MKKFVLIIFVMSLIFLPVWADGTDIQSENPDDTSEFGMIYEPDDESDVEELSQDNVYLNSTNEEEVFIKKPKKFTAKKYNFTTKQDKNISPQNAYQFENFNPYESKSTSFTSQKQLGNFTLGTKYDSSYAPDSTTQTSTLFSKYQKNKFSFNTSYKSNSLAPIDQRGKGTLSFSPEYKLNNHVSVQNIYSTSFLDKNKKSEIVFSLKPFKDDRLDLNVGASQIYSETSAPTRSQLNFSTKFRF